MICPKCGKELEEGKLLCESCGYEFEMVPVFDIELEEELRENIRSVIEDIAAQEPEKNVDKKPKRHFLTVPAALHKLKQMFVVFVAVVVAGGITFTVIYARNNQKDRFEYEDSYLYYYEKAINCAEQSNYQEAVSYLEKALMIDPDNVEAAFLLAKYYDKNGQQQSTMAQLNKILETEAGYSHRDEVYDMLLEIYAERSDFRQISDLLKECDVPRIVSKYNKYAAFAPEFNLKGDTYDKIISVVFTTNTQGTVYYTLDGTIPTEQDMVYETPILLEEGSHVIRAKFVNLYGVESKVVTQNYDIHLPVPSNPVVNIESGEYNEPQLIRIYYDNKINVYYTEDGSVPDKNSNLYVNPIEMPYGTSNFSFIAIDESGGCSEVVKRTFQLEAQANFDADLALQVLKNNLWADGQLLNVEGNVSGKLGINRYYVQTLYKEENIVFYIVSEEYVDTIGKAHNTGILYAIDVNTADLYKAIRAGEGKYVLEFYMTPIE